MIKVKKLNLQDKAERQKYSEKLKNFEKEFIYPLGEKSFYISHGEQSDYFSFFEKLGTPEFLILESGNDLIGVVCLVLRSINGKKSWYACDFKISKAYRGQKLYRKWMWKFFVPLYLKCQRLYGINMSEPEENKLWKHTQKIFKVFSVGIKPYYLYEFSAQNLSDISKEILLSHSLMTNNGVKDIIVNAKPVSIYHLVLNDHIKNNLVDYKIINQKDIKADACVMFLISSKVNLPFAKETVVSLIHRNNESLYISSLEI